MSHRRKCPGRPPLLLFPPHGLEIASMFQNESASFRCSRRRLYKRGLRGAAGGGGGSNPWLVINVVVASDPARRRCFPAQATITQRSHTGRQAQASAIRCIHILIQNSSEPRAWKGIPIAQTRSLDHDSKRKPGRRLAENLFPPIDTRMFTLSSRGSRAGG